MEKRSDVPGVGSGGRVGGRLGGERIDGVLELLEGDGFGEMEGEAGVVGIGDVLWGAEAADGDGMRGSVFLELLDELDACTIGEVDVGDEELEGIGSGDLEGIADIGGGLDAVSEHGEELSKEIGCGSVIFDEEDRECAGGGIRGRIGWCGGGLVCLEGGEADSGGAGVVVTAGIDEVEEVVDQAGLKLDLGVDRGELFADGRRESGVLFDGSDGEEDGGEGGAQFVAKEGDEAVFGFVGGLRSEFSGAELFGVLE